MYPLAAQRQLGGLGVTPAGGVALYTISGTVYDSNGTTPIASAVVALGALSANSGVDGTFTIADVPAGTTGSLTCTKAGYSWTAKTIAAMSGDLTGQNYTNAWWAFGGIAASCVRAYQAIGAASLADSYINLVNPGDGDAVPGTAPTWNATDGWIFASGVPLLDTGFVPTDVKNCSMSVRFSQTAITTNYIIVGESDANGQFNIMPNRAGPDGYRLFIGQGSYTALPQMSSGVLGMAGIRGFKDGAYVFSPSDLTFTPPTSTIKVGGRACAIQALAIYNVKLTDAQMIGVQNAQAALANP